MTYPLTAMHTLYRWEFSKIKKNLLTPMNAISEDELTPKASAWVSVKDGLPEALVNVQVSWYRKEYGDFTTRGYQVAGGLWSIISWDGKITGANVTHWMPLPSPPEAG